MKRSVTLSVALAAVLLAGCVEKSECEKCGAYSVKVDLGGSPATRAHNVSPEEDAAVVDCRLYVFDSRGSLVTSLDNASGSFEFYLEKGTYSLDAICNARGRIVQPTDRSSLLSTVSALADNSPGSFQMYGCTENLKVDSDLNVTVEVRRLVAKVQGIVRTKWQSPALAALPFKVTRIFLTNVQGENNYARTGWQGDDGLWYNKRNLASSPVDSLLDSGPMERLLGDSDSLVTDLSLYPYPNRHADPSDRSNWSARCTRWVVETQLGDKTCYYPVTLPTVESNKRYWIDLTVTKPGVKDPEDIPTEEGYVEVAIKVAPWDEGGTISAKY